MSLVVQLEKDSDMHWILWGNQSDIQSVVHTAVHTVVQTVQDRLVVAVVVLCIQRLAEDSFPSFEVGYCVVRASSSEVGCCVAQASSSEVVLVVVAVLPLGSSLAPEDTASGDSSVLSSALHTVLLDYP